MTSETSHAAAPQREKGRRDFIFDLTVKMAREDFGTGSLASLRRHSPERVAREPAFHRLLAGVPDDMLKAQDAPVRWAAVIQAIAIGAKPGEPASRESAGKALAEAGYSESRFARLLAAGGSTLRAQIMLLARYMNGKQARFSWADLGELVLVEGWNGECADILRFRLARDYFRQLDTRQT
jgi:CRISPR system Cascade subunit CasB